MTSVKAKTVEERMSKMETDMDFLKQGMSKLLEKGKKNHGIIKIQKPKEIKNPHAVKVLEDTLKKVKQLMIIIDKDGDVSGLVIELFQKNFLELAEKIKTTPVGKTVDIVVYKIHDEMAIQTSDNKWVLSANSE